MLSRLENIEFGLKDQLKQKPLMQNIYEKEIKQIKKAKKILNKILLSYGISEK